MKKRSLLILSVIALVIASCGKKGGKTGLLVPKDASFVIHINSASLSSKITWDEIRNTNWFKTASAKNEDSMAQQLLADPAKSGIDIKKDFVIYLKPQGRAGYMVAEGSLTSEASYEQMLVEMSKKESKEIKKSGEFSYVDNKESVIVWNKAMFAVVSNVNMAKAARMMKRSMDDDEEGGTGNFSSDSLRIFGEQALTIEGGNNLDADSRFADLVKDGSDVHLWVDIEKIYAANAANPMMAMMNINALTEGNIIALSMNFDNGKMTLKSKHYTGEKMRKIAADNKPSSITADEINRIPATDVYAVAALNYSPEGLKETLKVTGLSAMADAMLRQVDFSIDDFVKANKGEIIIAAGDASVNPVTPATGDKPAKPSVKYIFATAVKDKAEFEKMVTLVWDFSKQMKKKYSTRDSMPDMSPSAIPGVSYRVENNWFALSNAPEYTDKFLAGNSNHKFAFTDKITGHPIGMYVDLQKVMKMSSAMMTPADSGKVQALNLSLGMWQDMVAKGGDFNGKASEFEFEVNLVDKNTNSLKQLNQYLDKMSQIKGEDGMSPWKMDIMKKRAERMGIKDEEVKLPPAPPAEK